MSVTVDDETSAKVCTKVTEHTFKTSTVMALANTKLGWCLTTHARHISLLSVRLRGRLNNKLKGLLENQSPAPANKLLTSPK
jgi:hypothetical protein